MAANEGVGKKIVEALKKQSEPEIEIEMAQDLSEVGEISEIDDGDADENITEIETSELDKLYDKSFQIKEENTNENEDPFVQKEQPLFDSSVEVKDIKESGSLFEPNVIAMSKQPQGWDFGTGNESQTSYMNSQIDIENVSVKQFEMPPNVAVLKRLIAQLPAGVSKQVGAQIIKQTMEALGISMNTVLNEAQKVQDDMNDSIKSCMLAIQKCKNDIKSLEKQGLDYQRQVNQLNDLISLFILSSRD